MGLANGEKKVLFSNNREKLKKLTFALIMEDIEKKHKDCDVQNKYDNVFKFNNDGVNFEEDPLVLYFGGDDIRNLDADGNEIDDDKLYLKVREYSYRVYPDDKAAEYEAFVEKYNLDTKRYALINEHTSPKEVEIK